MRSSLCVLVTLLLVSSTAQAGTALFVREQQGAFNKICYYDYLGDTYTKNISSVGLCPLNIHVKDVPQMPDYSAKTSPSAGSGIGFLVDERTGTFNKTCYYDYLGDTYTKDVSSVSLCPLSIQLRR